MRYYIVKLSWDKEFRFDKARDAALFLANAAEHAELDEDHLRSRGHDEASFDFYVKEDIDIEPETEETEELDLPFEEVGGND